MLRDMTLENPIRAIREISHDMTCTPPGAPGQRPRGQRPRDPDASTSTGRCATPSAATSARSRSRRSRCGSTASPPSRTTRSKLDREVDWVIKHNLIEAYREQARPAAEPPAGRAARPAVPRRQPRPRRSSTSCRTRGLVERICDDADIDDGRRDPAADHPGPAARRVHPPGQGAQARLHGRLGAPEAQRPGPAHGALQGPVQVPRRAGREAHRLALTRADRVARRRWTSSNGSST